jgi:hypothetical protein
MELVFAADAAETLIMGARTNLVRQIGNLVTTSVTTEAWGFGRLSAGITAGPASHSTERKGGMAQRLRDQSLFGDFRKWKLLLNADTHA